MNRSVSEVVFAESGFGVKPGEIYGCWVSLALGTSMAQVAITNTTVSIGDNVQVTLSFLCIHN